MEQIRFGTGGLAVAKSIILKFCDGKNLIEVQSKEILYKLVHISGFLQNESGTQFLFNLIPRTLCHYFQPCD